MKKEKNWAHLEPIQSILDELKDELQKIYGDRFLELILYGSYARGDAVEESDIDVVLLLKNKVQPSAEIERIIDVLTELNLKHQTLVSIFPIGEDEWKNNRLPLFINVQKEGILL